MAQAICWFMKWNVFFAVQFIAGRTPLQLARQIFSEKAIDGFPCGSDPEQVRSLLEALKMLAVQLTRLVLRLKMLLLFRILPGLVTVLRWVRTASKFALYWLPGSGVWFRASPTSRGGLFASASVSIPVFASNASKAAVLLCVLFSQWFYPPILLL